MSAYQPDISPSSEQGQALQAAIQHQLVNLGWTTDDDSVMAEYCLVMLGNRKTAEQVSTELSDLIGSDFEDSFVTWLFEEIPKHYPDPSSAAAPVAPTPFASLPTAPAPHNDSNFNNNGRRNGPGGRAVFGAAMSGVKRDSRDLDSPGQQPPTQRSRFDGVPNGPRSMGGNNNNQQGPRNGNANGGGAGPNGPQKSIFERVSPGFGGGNAMGMPQAAFDAISQTIEAVRNGAHPSALAAIPFPALAAHPRSAFLPPHILAQAQAAAMAQAQAYAAMQGVWNGGPPPQQGGGFNPSAPAFNPAFAGRGGPNQGFQQQHQGPPNGGFHQNQSQTFNTPKPSAPKTPAAVVLPTKPAEEQICKHGVECTKPQCPYSHPSPVATKESGLVLSSEACEKQLSCEDPDCPKSHVSPAQKNAPASATTTNANGQTTFTPAPTVRAPPVADPTAIPGAGEKPCKFAGACTRKGCVFLHPWDVRGDASRDGQGVPCRWGAGCTRADCHFSHPPSRPAPFSKPHGGAPPHGRYSATFNKPGKPTAAAGIGAWPAEQPTHVSDRLKRFAPKNDDGEQGERIIPGGGEGGETNKQGGGDDAKVEIVVEEESSPAATKVEEQ